MHTIQPCTMSCHFRQNNILRVHACLAVTCHLHFRQNDGDLLRATAVTRGWNWYRNKSHAEGWPWRRNLSRRSCRDSTAKRQFFLSALDHRFNFVLWSPFLSKMNYDHQSQRERERERETDRHTDRQTDRDTETHTDTERERDKQAKRERENSNSNSKTLFYKDCSLGSFKNLSNN